MTTYIFDIDGTLANINHRRHFVENSPKCWKSFFESMLMDEPNHRVVKLAKSFAKTSNILLVSGRPSDYKDHTVRWLEEHQIPWNGLFMRKAGDFRPDDIIKKEIWANEIVPKLEDAVDVLVIDDRDKVVQMWRSLGLECWQVANGNF